MKAADVIWNRAAMNDGGLNPERGDRALASLLYAHGYICNSGVLQAVEILTSEELAAAIAGYRHFGLGDVADLLVRSRELLDSMTDLDRVVTTLDGAYRALVPSDASLVSRFETDYNLHPDVYAPPEKHCG